MAYRLIEIMQNIFKNIKDNRIAGPNYPSYDYYEISKSMNRVKVNNSRILFEMNIEEPKYNTPCFGFSFGSYYYADPVFRFMTTSSGVTPYFTNYSNPYGIATVESFPTNMNKVDFYSWFLLDGVSRCLEIYNPQTSKLCFKFDLSCMFNFNSGNLYLIFGDMNYNSYRTLNPDSPSFKYRFNCPPHDFDLYSLITNKPYEYNPYISKSNDSILSIL